MKRMIALWVILFVTDLLARLAINYFIFNHVDVRYEAYANFLIASLAQMMVLAAALGIITRSSVLVPLKAIGKPTPAGLFLLADGLILLLTLMPGLPQWIRLDQPDGFANYYMGLKAVAAGILVVWGSFYRQWTDWDRRWLMLTGVILCALGIDYFMPWLAALSQPVLANRALLLGWMLFYGPLFGVVILLLARLETIWSRQSAEAGFMVRYAAGFIVLGGTMVGLNVFNRPYLLEPWSSIAKACAYLAITAVVAASIVAGLSLKGARLEGRVGEEPCRDPDSERRMSQLCD